MRRLALLYVVLLLVAGVVVAGVLHLGAGLPPPPGAPHAPGLASAPGWDVLAHPLGRLFAQLLIILAAAQAGGWLLRRCGQPAVVGEMMAGICLGPPVFGLIAPGAFAAIFPADALGTLHLLSQVGVCLFLFVVGMQLDIGHLRQRARVAVAVSHASIVFPAVLGVLLALPLYRAGDLAAPGAGFTPFALFLGVCMSITAFPVLARILQERGLARTELGTTAIACAAVDDVTAWTLLAAVVAVAQAGSMLGALVQLALIAVFVVVMLALVRPGLPRWLGSVRLAQAEPSTGAMAGVVCLVIASALATESLGIHALFGAFLAGVAMPEEHGFRRKVGVRVEQFTAVLLLPPFFVCTGLRMHRDLISDGAGWLLCLGIVAVATCGKLVGSAVAARLAGMGWREALQLAR